MAFSFSFCLLSLISRFFFIVASPSSLLFFLRFLWERERRRETSRCGRQSRTLLPFFFYCCCCFFFFLTFSFSRVSLLLHGCVSTRGPMKKPRPPFLRFAYRVSESRSKAIHSHQKVNTRKQQQQQQQQQAFFIFGNFLSGPNQLNESLTFVPVNISIALDSMVNNVVFPPGRTR